MHPHACTRERLFIRLGMCDARYYRRSLIYGHLSQYLSPICGEKTPLCLSLLELGDVSCELCEQRCRRSHLPPAYFGAHELILNVMCGVMGANVSSVLEAFHLRELYELNHVAGSNSPAGEEIMGSGSGLKYYIRHMSTHHYLPCFPWS